MNPNNPASTHHHQPHASFSSSVYSQPGDDNHNNNRPRPARQLSQLDTKNLPTLPTGPSTAPVKSSTPATDSPSYVQPPSRFSITTYATSTRSPRESLDADAPPLPTPPKDIVLGLANNNNNNANNMASTTTTTDASVLTRSRPQMRGGPNKWEDPSPADEEPPVKISLSKAWMTTAGANSTGANVQASPPSTRKPGGPKGPRELAPTAAETNKGGGLYNGFGLFGGGQKPPAAALAVSDGDNKKSPTTSSRPASIMSNMDKTLPSVPAPPVTSITPTTTDRIAQLNAQLQDLANRRMNFHRAIKQMTELMPQDNLIMQDAVRRKREDEKRKIEELKGKLDDIGREEHDLGMKLHRAYKKLDQQTEYEPTTLWVRRATGA